MNPKFRHENRSLTGYAALVDAVPRDDFGEAILDYVSSTAIFRNLSVIYFPDLSHPKPVQSVWSGQIGDYWLRQNGETIARDPNLHNPVLDDVRSAPTVGVKIERWHPGNRDPIKQMFEQFNVCERVTVASRGKRAGYQSFFLRDKAEGWLTDRQFSRLCDLLPLVHELIGLRHRLIGANTFQFESGAKASSLRERQVMRFSELSIREAEVCDCLAAGMTIAATAAYLGIAESTVRTLRQRAYRKLNVMSATQLMALIVHDSWND
ncbi:LuxR family transcriptional regulator [Ruegeria sp. HKCCD8929]|uniref:helix-turn-helix transcriptional regulator n=1 Tax=Ruegeria sp. HKCCD8929 TaxID=2683006 RepID=UPI0020C1E62B|nr:LuxR family transcriptional regulator [Ruegeria sp. HKCCD8929]